jgi:histidinol-phosphate/aromatic aminotransferase/cobyric acid decarboxylase-like protein
MKFFLEPAENKLVMAFKAITTVYSYRLPETRAIIDRLLKGGFPHRVFLEATNPPGALDTFHEPVIDKVLEFYDGSVPHLKDFPHRYPTSGSEEGIREIMTGLQMAGVKRIYVLKGEYEGYQAVGKDRGIEAVEVGRETDPARVEPGHYFISNPSARDGNILPNDQIRAICDAGHKVFYDLAYLGATRPHEFDLSHPGIFAAVISFSKTYGLFYDRIGFAFGREPIPSLYGNRWFKSIFGLMIAKAIVDGLSPKHVFSKYRHVQERIIAGINSEQGLNMRPSDAFLLGHITPEDARELKPAQLKMIEKFRRVDGYRFCLTPYFVELDPEVRRLK